MIRIGVDFGGTKIEAAALDADGRFLARVRGPTPKAYDDGIAAVVELIVEAERQAGAKADRVGVGGPGSRSPATGLMRNANAKQMKDRPFPEDLARALGRPVRYANDANCLALSEAVDGAGAGAKTVFAAILGTGCGGGLAVDGRPIEGRNRIAGEWGHTPLPWPRPAEYPGHRCWCGRDACLETYISGSGFVRDYEAATGRKLTGVEIETAAREGEPDAKAALDRYVDRLGRALAVVSDIFDPEVIVLAGGMSNTAELYDRVPEVVARHVFSDVYRTPIVKAAHGDSSGVRGAAWLWPIE
jgi:fructokinase